MEVTFDTENGVLRFTHEDGTVEEFRTRAELVAKYPDLERYANGMGWA